MHAGVITGLSRALDVLTNGSCAGAEKLEEARTDTIAWRDVDEDTFIHFFQFAYTGNYSSATPPVDMEAAFTAPSVDRTSAAATEAVPEATAEDVEDDVWAISVTRKPKKILWKKFRLLKYDDEKVEADERSTGPTHGHTDICLSHARVYVLADYYGIDRLMSLSLRKLHSTLASMTLSAERTPGFAELVRYSFKNTGDKSGKPDQLRHMLSLYTACRLEELWISREFQDLFKTEGEFSCEVITNMLGRLK